MGTWLSQSKEPECGKPLPPVTHCLRPQLILQKRSRQRVTMLENWIGLLAPFLCILAKRLGHRPQTTDATAIMSHVTSTCRMPWSIKHNFGFKCRSERPAVARPQRMRDTTLKSSKCCWFEQFSSIIFIRINLSIHIQRAHAWGSSYCFERSVNTHGDEWMQGKSEFRTTSGHKQISSSVSSSCGFFGGHRAVLAQYILFHGTISIQNFSTT